MIITIDGPAGSGKSTVARALAARLGIAYLDTGAMYRAVAHAVLQRGIDPSGAQAVADLAMALDLEVDCGPKGTRVSVDGSDVSGAIRNVEVGAATSRIATIPAVRAHLISLQRRTGERLGSFVSEGRDQGRVVFPDADAKFVVEASLRERAERRYCELIVARGRGQDFQVVKSDLVARDHVDVKQWQPLVSAGDAIVVDTTSLTVSEVVTQMEGILRDRGLLGA